MAKITATDFLSAPAHEEAPKPEPKPEPAGKVVESQVRSGTVYQPQQDTIRLALQIKPARMDQVKRLSDMLRRRTRLGRVTQTGMILALLDELEESEDLRESIAARIYAKEQKKKSDKSPIKLT